MTSFFEIPGGTSAPPAGAHDHKRSESKAGEKFSKTQEAQTSKEDITVTGTHPLVETTNDRKSLSLPRKFGATHSVNTAILTSMRSTS